MALAFPSRDQAFSPTAGQDHATPTPAFDTIEYYTKSGETSKDRGAHDLVTPMNFPAPKGFPRPHGFSN
jgi:hypothetical protein